MYSREKHYLIYSLALTIRARILQFPDGDGAMPAPLRLSYARLKEHGVYLLENGQEMYLWIGKAAQAAWIQQVLGAASFQSVDITMVCGFVMDREGGFVFG